MRSTFMGLETARRGMFTQQSALYTTGQNVANASTPGYSRQRVNFSQTEPYPGAGMNMPQLPGQMGTGVKADSVQRIRESFLDVQYRNENNKLGYWQTRADSMDKMESIMNEPSDSGLSTVMDQFWQSLQDLAVDPTNSGARSVVRQRGEAVSETFNYLYSSLSTVKQDQNDQIDVTVKEINSITYQLDQVNKQIGSVEPHGLLPNDLYDERDRLIDQLSSLVNIKVEYEPSKGNADPKAEGTATVKLINDSGSELGILLGGSSSNQLNVNYNGVDGSVKTISIGSTNIDFSNLNSSGKLSALIESYGYESNGSETGVYSKMLNDLDNLAFTFAMEFNDVHSKGLSPNEIASGKTEEIPFFSGATPTDVQKGYAARIGLSDQINASLDNIATAGGTDPTKATLGDSTNITALANVINQKLEYSPNQMSDFRNYYQNVIGGMAVISQEATRLAANTSSLQQSVDQKRQSVSSVSLDEEMTNMVQFQHAYNASARMITIQDEMLDKIINGMGTGGR
ncbi:flagellar hook-associated protein FlgK [Neobacillus terrae]|uniref:flagellar hook-associated protein FlgK n=1 Tax=Neobacillus terrae TaxID=3034837 RepID=UPI001409A1DE|nr:flagellar hook-associated protein FlgK [Neobacillus terrae]NHM29968.1 flagellar hook-associated protein FlgK [Neobacillus terrae]